MNDIPDAAFYGVWLSRPAGKPTFELWTKDALDAHRATVRDPSINNLLRVKPISPLDEKLPLDELRDLYPFDHGQVFTVKKAKSSDAG